jgi:predicted HTH transcriptional regulator
MLTQEELKTAIAFGREQRGIEFKGPGKRSDKLFMAKVVRAMLGMGNKRGGGVVTVGVKDDGTNLDPIGLSHDELATWSYDDLAASVSNYADPYLDFDIARVELDGNTYVIIEVRQFDSTPVICKKSLEPTLRNGALYVRPRGKKIETVECPSHVEMREIIGLAAESRVRELLSTIARVQPSAREAVSERAKLDKEAEDLL